MVIRQTSVVAYNEIEASGLLSAMRWKVYAHLFRHGPLTAGELTHAIKGPDEVHPSYHRRLDELGELGCAYRVRIRPCNITGHEVHEWDVTNKLPVGKISHGSETPTLAEMREAVEELRLVYQDILECQRYFEKLKSAGELQPWMTRILNKKSMVFSETLLKVCEWIKKKAQ